MLMAIFLRGMDEQETVDLTRNMMLSGDVMEWPAEWQGLMVDKHSTGGVGDKVSLPLAPALAACDVKDFTGGTLDKLESIKGFNVSQSPENVRSILNDVGCCIVGQTNTLVPADRILYAIRDVTGTVESTPLIAGSIVSKKAAENLSALILDVKCGKGALMKTMEEAKNLADIMVRTGEGLGVKTSAIVSDMDNPLGKAIGNALEVIESLECLNGKGPKSLRYLVTTLGGNLLYNAGKVTSPEAGCQKIADALDNGQAMKKWRSMLKQQGVSSELANELCLSNANYTKLLPTATHTHDIKAGASGYVGSIDPLACAMVCKNLGAGRTYAGQELDLSVGIQLHIEVGDKVNSGETWATVHYNKDLPSSYIAELGDALTLQSTPPPNHFQDIVKEIIKG